MTLRITVDPTIASAAPSQQLQYLRKCSLFLTNDSEALDLSQMRIRFRTSQSEIMTPNSATIRVYNLSDTTAKRAQQEFSKVTLQAGYRNGPFGVIFSGTIKQVRRGRVTPTETYLDILAADGDEGYIKGIVNKTFAAGWQTQDAIAETAKGMQVGQGYVLVTPPVGAASRPKVMYGMARDHMRTIANSHELVWSIQDGKLQAYPKTSYIPGTVIQLNAQTGMIGLPEQTEGGIEIKALINPALRIGAAVQINNSSIQRAFLGPNYLYAEGRLEQLPGFDSLLPKITNDGIYRVYVAEYEGDTRGQEWYANLTCLAIDKSAATDQSVQPAATQ